MVPRSFESRNGREPQLTCVRKQRREFGSVAFRKGKTLNLALLWGATNQEGLGVEKGKKRKSEEEIGDQSAAREGKRRFETSRDARFLREQRQRGESNWLGSVRGRNEAKVSRNVRDQTR